MNLAPDLNAEPEAPLVEGDVIDSRYRVEGVIGRGGMGIVVSAVHLQLGKRVAIKALTPSASEDDVARERFLREARAAAQLRNDHVVQVLDFGILENGSPVIVMELLKGYDLEQELYLRGRMPPEEVADLLLQACEAVAEAHAHGLVHRDLKPSNLYVARAADGTPHVKVLDFGVSKMVPGRDGGISEPSLTGTHKVVGSPSYMAPEQVEGDRPHDSRTDVWALGVILFELLTNTLPFDGTSVPRVFVSILRDDPPPLRRRCSDAPTELEDLIRWSLEKEPEDRCPDVATFAQHLAAAFPSPLRSEAASRVKRVASAPLNDTNASQLRLVGEQSHVSNWTLASLNKRSSEAPRVQPRYALMAGVAVLLLLVGLAVWRIAGLDNESNGATSAAPTLSAPASTQVSPASPAPSASFAPVASGLVEDAGEPDGAQTKRPPSATPPLPPNRHGRTLETSTPSASAPPGRDLGRDPLKDRK